MTAQINSTAIEIRAITPRTSKKLSVNRPPGTNSDAIEGLGSQGAELKVDLWSDTLANKHTVTAEFLKTGPQVLEDPDGYIYNIVESSAVGGRVYTAKPNSDIAHEYSFNCVTEEPFKFSSTEKERIKTITTNNQEWSADNSAVDITTLGTVDVLPTLELVAGAKGADYNTYMAIIQQDHAATSTVSGTSYSLTYTETFTAVEGKAWKPISTKFTVTKVLALPNLDVDVRIYAAGINGGVELSVYTATMATDYGPETFEYTIPTEYISDGNTNLEIRYYTRVGDGSGQIYNIESVARYIGSAVLKDLTIYNTADTTRKTQMCNKIMPGTTVEIFKNGTGTFNYPDDYTSDTYKYVSYDYNNVTYNATIDVVTLAAVGGYIVYKIDTKYPITGIPKLELFANGVIQLSIAKNVNGIPGTYYEVDDQSSGVLSSEIVTHLLDNILNCRLKGETSFFVKIYTDGATDLTYTNLSLDADIVTIDTLLPYVYLGAANTFRADQNSDSSLNATVTLNYRDAHWVI